MTEAEEAREHPSWETFTEWASDNGVDPYEHEEDWLPWWKCFLAGYDSI